MLTKLERIFEWLLWESRFFIILAVVASIASAILLIVLGTYDIFILLEEFFHVFSNKEVYEEFHKRAVAHIIGAIDFYLIATVLIIFGVGLYELFISKIDYAEQDTRSSRILVIHSLDQLKEKLAKVIIMVLIVTFFKHALGLKYENVLNVLYLGAGILLVALALYFTHKGDKSKH
ncbi:MAG: YqhA family protein [Thermodesulfovibrionales bacterium]|nr:YqhA family protein [Thermodesulfovibrionales bacterium]